MRRNKSLQRRTSQPTISPARRTPLLPSVTRPYPNPYSKQLAKTATSFKKLPKPKQFVTPKFHFKTLHTLTVLKRNNLDIDSRIMKNFKTGSKKGIDEQARLKLKWKAI